MKKIEAVVRPEKLDDVRKALEASGYPGIMITEIEGHGKQKGATLQWRGEQYKMELLSKVKIEVVCNDGDVEKILKTIMDTARTGNVGDGKIFVFDVKDVVRIRTGEKGETAI